MTGTRYNAGEQRNQARDRTALLKQLVILNQMTALVMHLRHGRHLDTSHTFCNSAHNLSVLVAAAHFQLVNLQSHC